MPTAPKDTLFCEFFYFYLPLKKNIKVSNETFNIREGILLKISDNEGHVGWGECAPLPGLHDETIEECLAAFNYLVGKDQILKLEGEPNFYAPFFNCLNFERKVFMNDFFSEVGVPTSVQFSIEQALLNLHEEKNGLLTNKMNFPLKVGINTLLLPEELKNYSIFLKDSGSVIKVKIGRLELEEEIELIKKFCSQNKNFTLRLDANNLLTISELSKIDEELGTFPIDYIEDPIDIDLLGYDCSQQLKKLKIPWGLDELLLNYFDDSNNFLFDLLPSQVKTIVLKPTRLTLSGTLDLIRQIESRGQNLKYVISSTFDTGLSILTHVWISQALQVNSWKHGLNTTKYFVKDILENPLDIKSGYFKLDRGAELCAKINTRLLTQINLKDHM